MYDIIDFATKKKVIVNDLVFTGEKSPFQINMNLDYVKQQINLDYFSSVAPCLSKYLPLMPIKKQINFISLRESATPLVKSKYIGKDLGIELYFKVEGKNPTGSFKDRGSAVDITVAKELGAKGIILASTGNMAASCSCYAAAADIPCFILVPEGVSLAKMAQVISYGGKIIQVKGTYNDAALLAYKIAKKKGFYLAGDYAFRVEGQKTAAFEIIDQLLFQTPDEVVIPVGCGTNIAAYYKGFQEYCSLGLIDEMPRLTGVQATGANPLVKAFKSNSLIKEKEKIETIASAIAVPNPIDGVKALDAIKRTNGTAEDVSDHKMLRAQYLLSTKEGLFVECSAAATIAYLYEQHRKRNLKPGSKVVCILSGDGLKDPDTILKSAIQPPVIIPSESAFNKLFDANFFDNKNMFFCNKNDIVFDYLPTTIELKSKLLNMMGVKYSTDFMCEILKNIEQFLRKGKQIKLADIQDIIQYVSESNTYINKGEPLVVSSFKVVSEYNSESYAEVSLRIGERHYKGSHKGTGPLDAVIQSLIKACPEKVEYNLKDYSVKIRSEGVDAVVNVEITLFKNGKSVIGRAISPDSIQASIEAFIDAYNSN
jgi:threonine synthase